MSEVASGCRPRSVSHGRAFAAAAVGSGALAIPFLGAGCGILCPGYYGLAWGPPLALAGGLAGGLAFAAIAPALRFRVWVPLAGVLSLICAAMIAATGYAIACSRPSAAVLLLTSALIASPVVAAAAAGAWLYGRRAGAGRRQ